MATLHEHPSWLLHEHGYRPERESGVESRFAVSNGFLGVRAARAISRGAMWVSWSHTLSWASWPRTYVAGLFDTPNIQPPVPALVPGPDWLRICLLVDGEPLVLRSGQLLDHRRTLDMRRGLLLGEWRHRNRAGHTVHVRDPSLGFPGGTGARAAVDAAVGRSARRDQPRSADGGGRLGARCRADGTASGRLAHGRVGQDFGGRERRRVAARRQDGCLRPR